MRLAVGLEAIAAHEQGAPLFVQSPQRGLVLAGEGAASRALRMDPLASAVVYAAPVEATEGQRSILRALAARPGMWVAAGAFDGRALRALIHLGVVETRRVQIEWASRSRFGAGRYNRRAYVTEVRLGTL